MIRSSIIVPSCIEFWLYGRAGRLLKHTLALMALVHCMIQMGGFLGWAWGERGIEAGHGSHGWKMENGNGGGGGG